MIQRTIRRALTMRQERGKEDVSKKTRRYMRNVKQGRLMPN
jgi:hypothetical protein